MTDVTPSEQRGPACPIQLVEVSVVLVGEANNPTILNPDFLENHVLPTPWPLKDSPVCTPVFAQVSYTNGVSVRSEPNRVSFEQNATDSSGTDVLVADLALKYVRAVPHVKYTAVGINPTVIMTVNHDLFELVHLIRSDVNLRHKQILPTVQMKLIYLFPTKRITMEMRNVVSKSESKKGIRFQGNIHRSDIGGAQHKRIERLEQIIGSCDHDIRDFTALVRDLDLVKDAATNE